MSYFKAGNITELLTEYILIQKATTKINCSQERKRKVKKWPCWRLHRADSQGYYQRKCALLLPASPKAPELRQETKQFWEKGCERSCLAAAPHETLKEEKSLLTSSSSGNQRIFTAPTDPMSVLYYSLHSYNPMNNISSEGVWRRQSSTWREKNPTQNQREKGIASTLLLHTETPARVCSSLQTQALQAAPVASELDFAKEQAGNISLSVFKAIQL